MKVKGAFDPRTLRCIEKLKTFLSPNHRASKRGAMYTLLSEGLLSSTTDFHNFNRAMNRVLEDGTRCDEHFSDECFDDNRRRTQLTPTWRNKAEFVESCSEAWRLDYWQNQPTRVEVFLEKDTASFLVQEVTERLQVPLRVSAGNFSRTFLYRIAESISSTNVPIKILYIGDFDPSGLDIERAAMRGSNGREGLADFLQNDFGWKLGRFEKQVTWVRVGVTEDEWRTMPDKARVPLKDKSQKDDGTWKKGDPRAVDFKARYGDYGVEVEALEVMNRGGLAQRLDAAIQSYIDPVAWEQSKQQEDFDRPESGGAK